MPRDDLSIDFVRKMPPAAELDPALILDEWIHNTQNLPEEIRFLQDEIAEKDRQYDKLVKEIDKNDERIQKFIKANGSFQPNPKEEECRATILKNFELAEQLSKEKLELTRKLQQTFDKHLRALDKQIKVLYDRRDPGFTDPDELPSLVRDSAANITSAPTALRPVNGNHPISSALNGLANGTGPNGSAAARSNQIRNVQGASQHNSASAPATPAATIILNQQRTRENSAGPGGGGGAARKGAVRSNSGLNLQTSGLGRHSSLGPGTPKSSGGVSAGVQRAGSAGPRGTGKATGGSTSRKSVPSGSSAASRKKGSSGPSAGSGSGAALNGSTSSTSGHKSSLSRVLKRAGSGTGTKNTPNASRANSTGDSDLSDADSNLSGHESDIHRRVGGTGTGGRNTPSGSHSRSVSHYHTNSSFSHKDDPSLGHHPSSSLANSTSTSHFAPRTSLPSGSGSAPRDPSSGGGHSRNRSSHLSQQFHRSPTLSSSHHPHLSNHNPPTTADDSDLEMEDPDTMDLDDEEAGDDRKYCLCQNVSFGDMVACDNDECPYEWFHWSCVGLKSEPNGTWYCPVCAKNMERDSPPPPPTTTTAATAATAGEKGEKDGNKKKGGSGSQGGSQGGGGGS